MLLQLGDKGDNVKYLQYGLHILCCSPNGFDGEFGNGTLTAVKKFQSKYGLVNDGIVGDVITITTKTGNKTVLLEREGVVTNIINRLVSGSTWLNLKTGENKFYVTASEGLNRIKVRLIHRNAYLGV